jgi:hypothetical protein
MEAPLLIERLRIVSGIRPIGAEVAPVFWRGEEASYPDLSGFEFRFFILPERRIS